jgi:hypothetical protein
MLGMPVQYDIRRDEAGWSVFDRWTGQVVILQGAVQSGLPEVDAGDLADRLNRRRYDGDRRILQ